MSARKLTHLVVSWKGDLDIGHRILLTPVHNNLLHAEPIIKVLGSSAFSGDFSKMIATM